MLRNGPFSGFWTFLISSFIMGPLSITVLPLWLLRPGSSAGRYCSTAAEHEYKWNAKKISEVRAMERPLCQPRRVLKVERDQMMENNMVSSIKLGKKSFLAGDQVINITLSPPNLIKQTTRWHFEIEWQAHSQLWLHWNKSKNHLALSPWPKYCLWATKGE